MTTREKKYNLVHKVKYITGFRPKQEFYALSVPALFPTLVYPTDFFTKPKVNGPWKLWDTDEEYHIPRSLCSPARITVRSDNNQIISKTIKSRKVSTRPNVN